MRFFLVDRVDSLVPGSEARGVKCVTLSEQVLHDHFPEHPLYPGTLIVEALAQLGGFLVESSRPEDGRRAVLGQIEQARFYRPATAGDRLELRVSMTSLLEAGAQIEGEATVDGERSAVARLTYALRPVESERVHEQRRELYALWTRGLDPGSAR